MGTGILATVDDTPKIANVSERIGASTSHDRARLEGIAQRNFVPPCAYERAGGGGIARLPGTENLHCRRYATGPRVAVLSVKKSFDAVPDQSSIFRRPD
jgi:hypothetical protein